MLELDKEELKKLKAPVLVHEQELKDKNNEIMKLRRSLEKAEKEKIDIELKVAESKSKYQKYESRSEKRSYEKLLEDLKQNVASSSAEPFSYVSKVENWSPN